MKMKIWIEEAMKEMVEEVEKILGCNTNLVAPVTIGAGAYTAAGATVTRDVPEDAMLIARAEQTVKPGLARRFRREKK